MRRRARGFATTPGHRQGGASARHVAPHVRWRPRWDLARVPGAVCCGVSREYRACCRAVYRGVGIGPGDHVVSCQTRPLRMLCSDAEGVSWTGFRRRCRGGTASRPGGGARGAGPFSAVCVLDGVSACGVCAARRAGGFGVIAKCRRKGFRRSGARFCPLLHGANKDIWGVWGCRNVRFVGSSRVRFRSWGASRPRGRGCRASGVGGASRLCAYAQAGSALIGLLRTLPPRACTRVGFRFSALA